MTEGTSAKAAIKTRTMEIAVAVFILLCGAIVIYDSARLGAKWGEDGPEAGYFPFYIGLIICISSAVILLQCVLGAGRDNQAIFVEWPALRQVLSVLLPAGLFVLGIQVIGLYVAAVLYIAGFMIWL